MTKNNLRFITIYNIWFKSLKNSAHALYPYLLVLHGMNEYKLKTGLVLACKTENAVLALFFHLLCQRAGRRPNLRCWIINRDGASSNGVNEYLMTKS